MRILLAKVTELGGVQGKIGDVAPNTGFGPWGSAVFNTAASAAGNFAKILSNLLGIMTIIAGLWFMVNLISGGYFYFSAAGSVDKMKSATERIGSSLIGLIVVIAAYAVISLIGGLLGFRILDVEVNIGKITP
jgi:hypothetical protein